MRTSRRSFLVGILLGGWCAVWAAPAGAQGLTVGSVDGSVQDFSGTPLGDAVLTLRQVGGGLIRAATSDRSGAFHLALVPPGEYELRAEHLGYRPALCRGVIVRGGTIVRVAMVVRAAPPPVLRVDTVRFAEGATVAATPGEWFTTEAVRGLPDPTGGILDLARLSTSGSAALASQGLPEALSGFRIDGLPYRPARNPFLPGGQLDSPLLRLSTLSGADLATNSADVEWSGFGGSTLLALSRQGTHDVQVHFSADGTGDALSGSQYFNTGATPNSSFRGSMFLTGPVVRDSAQFILGVEGQRLETPMPAPLVASAVAESLVTIAQDSFHVGLGNYLGPHVATTDAVTALGGLDWHLSGTSEVVAGLRYATATIRNPDLGLGAAPSLGAGRDDHDFVGSVTLRSALSSSLSQEFQGGVQLSTRTYEGTSLLETDVVELGTAVGSDPALPARYDRTVAHFGETLHDDLRVHHLEFGATVTLNSYDQTLGVGNPGAFTFAGPGAFAQLEGAYLQSIYAAPEVQFSVPQFGLYAQDRMNAAPGLDLLLGLRYDAEALPRGDIVVNQAWQQVTGLSNAAFPTELAKVSPRAAFTWDIGERHTTLIHGAAGVYFDEVDPGILGEAIRESLGDTARSALGSLAGWPSVPDSLHSASKASDLMLVAPGMQAPRTGRLDLSLAQQLGSALTAVLSGTYRHTDFLPRRTDLNLPLAPTASDQYGRPVFGTLVQEGELVTVQPGTNARFAGFDVVSGIDPDGYSDYWGATLSLERQFGRTLRLFASYTYSRTTDNLLGAARGGPGGSLSPFPDSLGGQDWANGRSDFDAPQRVALAAEIVTHLPLAPRIAAVYRYRSGYPFTPGFQPGVDVSGTGSGLDPAFVDAAVPGMANLLAQWGCLRSQVGQFATRNSCEDPGLQSLDLRVTFSLLRLHGTPFMLVIDALNVLESDVGVRDHALYVINGSKTLAVNPATGVVTIPLVANPNFGNVLVHETTGRELRIGLRVNF